MESSKKPRAVSGEAFEPKVKAGIKAGVCPKCRRSL